MKAEENVCRQKPALILKRPFPRELRTAAIELYRLLAEVQMEIPAAPSSHSAISGWPSNEFWISSSASAAVWRLGLLKVRVACEFGKSVRAKWRSGKTGSVIKIHGRVISPCITNGHGLRYLG